MAHVSFQTKLIFFFVCLFYLRQHGWMTLFFASISAHADPLWKRGCADTSRGDYTHVGLTATASWPGVTGMKVVFSSPPFACYFPNIMYLGSMRAPIYQRYSTKKSTCFSISSQAALSLPTDVRDKRSCNCWTYIQTNKTSKLSCNGSLIGMNQLLVSQCYCT